MTTEKNAIGFPTESGGFEEIASDAPKASPDGLTAQDVAYGNETVDDALTELNSKIIKRTHTLNVNNNNYGSYKFTETGYSVASIKFSLGSSSVENNVLWWHIGNDDMFTIYFNQLVTTTVELTAYMVKS